MPPMPIENGVRLTVTPKGKQAKNMEEEII